MRLNAMLSSSGLENPISAGAPSVPFDRFFSAHAARTRLRALAKQAKRRESEQEEAKRNI
jgi:hypothetical protein